MWRSAAHQTMTPAYVFGYLPLRSMGPYDFSNHGIVDGIEELAN